MEHEGRRGRTVSRAEFEASDFSGGSSQVRGKL